MWKETNLCDTGLLFHLMEMWWSLNTLVMYYKQSQSSEQPAGYFRLLAMPEKCWDFYYFLNNGLSGSLNTWQGLPTSDINIHPLSTISDYLSLFKIIVCTIGSWGRDVPSVTGGN